MNEKLVRYFEEILKAHNVNEEGARRIAEEIVEELILQEAIVLL